MPKMDGLTFLRTLRRGEAPMSTIPALMTSTEAKDSDKEDARAAGANFYLVKPIKADAMIEHVNLLAGRRA
jgi:two-component system, chemotaxis family, chemotaxis protein CheY